MALYGGNEHGIPVEIIIGSRKAADCDRFKFINWLLSEHLI